MLTVPSYFTNIERKALLDAANIAELNCQSLINENTAMVLNYGFFRKDEFGVNDKKTVIFVDIGHSKTTITFAEFRKTGATILFHNSERNLGGRNLDYKIMEALS